MGRFRIIIVEHIHAQMTKLLLGHLLILIILQCINAWKPALKAFKQKKAFKVISGLNNFDEANVVDVCWAAEHGGLHTLILPVNPS